MQLPDELSQKPSTTATREAERHRLAVGLAESESRLAEQARVFVPLVALALIAAMPVWANSLARFLKLLASPFVLLPVGFCIAHLAISWRKIIRMRHRLHEAERAMHEQKPE